MSDTWQGIRADIWNCATCKGHQRVELNIRQQTEIFHIPPKLLVVAVAPPFTSGVHQKILAASITNSSDDQLRKFLVETLAVPWDALILRGLAVVHAVKCAIIPDAGGFQNPHPKIVDVCAQQHFAREFVMLQAPVVIALGGAARRAVIRVPNLERPAGLKLSGPLNGEFKVRRNDHNFSLFITKFPRGDGRKQARKDMEAAVTRAGF